MEKHIFKSAAFGGFDKQDVANYIEQTSREYAERTALLEQERDGLRAENETLRRDLEAARAEAEEQSSRLKQQQTALEEAASRTARLAELQAQVEALTARVSELEPEAASYRQFRDRIGDIECDARSRAAELERSTYTRLRQATASFREQYRALTAAFGTASSYVTEELRKVEVQMTQLPRSLDQIGAELQSMDETLGDR